MDFLNTSTFSVITLILLLVSVGLSIFALLQMQAIKNTFKSAGVGDSSLSLQDMLDEHLQKYQDLSGRTELLEDLTKKHSGRLDRKVGKVGFMRFNPYGDTGGDQSFCVALLDDNDDGVVITTLFRRGATQTFSKKILAGKSENNLTAEETQTIKLAQGN